MAAIIEEESQSLVEHYKKLIMNKYNDRMTDSKTYCNNNEPNDGQIYKLTEKNNVDKSACTHKKERTVADMYMKVNEFVEFRKMAQSTIGIAISMDDAFGVTVLNTLWRMMASKRLSLLYFHFTILIELLIILTIFDDVEVLLAVAIL